MKTMAFSLVRVPFLCCALLPMAVPSSAGAQTFLPPEPDSLVYQSFALAAELSVELFEGLTLTGNVHSNGDLELASGGFVQGDVGAHSFLAIDGAVSGAAVEGTALIALPVPYDEVVGRGMADRVFEESVSFSGNEVIDDVVFVAGNVRFQKGLVGRGTVVAIGDIVLERGIEGASMPSDRLALVALGDIVLEKRRAFRGALVAQGDIEFEEEVSFIGVAVSHGRLSVDETASVTFEAGD